MRGLSGCCDGGGRWGVRHHLAYRLRQYAALCDRAPLAAGLLVGGLAAIVVNVDLAPKARIARWVARRIER